MTTYHETVITRGVYVDEGGDEWSITFDIPSPSADDLLVAFVAEVGVSSDFIGEAPGWNGQGTMVYRVCDGTEPGTVTLTQNLRVSGIDGGVTPRWVAAVSRYSDILPDFTIVNHENRSADWVLTGSYPNQTIHLAWPWTDDFERLTPDPSFAASEFYGAQNLYFGASASSATWSDPTERADETQTSSTGGYTGRLQYADILDSDVDTGVDQPAGDPTITPGSFGQPICVRLINFKAIAETLSGEDGVWTTLLDAQVVE